MIIKTNESDLRKNFETFGTIVDVCVKSKDSGIVFAFIEFDSSDSAEKAIQGYSNLQIWMKFNFHQFTFCSKNILI